MVSMVEGVSPDGHATKNDCLIRVCSEQLLLIGVLRIEVVRRQRKGACFVDAWIWETGQFDGALSLSLGSSCGSIRMR